MIAFIALAEAILTIDPPTPFIAGSTDRHPRNTPRKFTPKMKSTSSSVASVIGLTVATPALLISASIRPSRARSEEHKSELQSLMRISYAVFCLKKKQEHHTGKHTHDESKRSQTHMSHKNNTHYRGARTH